MRRCRFGLTIAKTRGHALDCSFQCLMQSTRIFPPKLRPKCSRIRLGLSSLKQSLLWLLFLFLSSLIQVDRLPFFLRFWARSHSMNLAQPICNAEGFLQWFCIYSPKVYFLVVGRPDLFLTTWFCPAKFFLAGSLFVRERFKICYWYLLRGLWAKLGRKMIRQFWTK